MRVTAPVAEFSGEVAGVVFTDGVGDTADPAALAYFARHGYSIGKSVAPAVEPADAAPEVESFEDSDPEVESDSEPAEPVRKPRARKSA